MRQDARINRELVSRLLDEDLTLRAICRRSKLAQRTVQAICKELHRRPKTAVSRRKGSPLADIDDVRRRVKKYGVSATAAHFHVSRQAVYQRLAASA